LKLIQASLDAAGFKAAHQEGPAALALLDKEKNPDEAARKIGAAFIVRVNLKPVSFDDSRRVARTEGTVVEVHKVGEDKPLSWSTSIGVGGLADEDVLGRLGQLLAESMAVCAIPYLIEHPSVQSVAQSNDERAAKLRTYLAAQDKAIADHRGARDELFKNVEARVNMGAKMTLHHPGDAIESLVATGPLGALVVRQTFKYFAAPRTLKLELRATGPGISEVEPQKLEIVDLWQDAQDNAPCQERRALVLEQARREQGREEALLFPTQHPDNPRNRGQEKR
jgi:hypothetical protein